MRNDFESNYLAHHGILGMHWGKRNGPPYPLDAADHSQSEKKAGYKKSLGGGRNESLYDRKSSDNKKKSHLTDKQKKALKIGAAAVGTALVAYGGYRLATSSKARQLLTKGITGGKNVQDLINKGKDFVFTKQGNVIDNDLKLVKFNSKKSLSKSKLADGVNPKFSFYKPGSLMNCGNCALAYEARLRGFDVQAAMNEKGMTIAQMGSFFKGLRSDSIINPKTPAASLNWNDPLLDYDDIIKYGKEVEQGIKESLLKSYPDGARGAIFFPSLNGSHWISFEKVGKDIEWINSQKTDADLIEDYFCKYTYHKNSFDAQLTAIRFDDLDFNTNISTAVENNVTGKISNAVNKLTQGKKFDMYKTRGENWVTDSLDLYSLPKPKKK